LKDTIRGQSKTKAALSNTINGLQKDVKEMDTANSATKLARHNENKVFKEAYKDAGASLRAVHQALKATTVAQGQTSSLLQDFFASHAAQQTSLLDVTQELSQRRQELMQWQSSMDDLKEEVADVDARARADADEDDADAGSPPPAVQAKGDAAAHVDQYDSKSGKVIELLKNLKMEFEDNMRELLKGETNAVNSFKLQEVAAGNSRKAAQSSLKENQKMLAETEKSLAAADLSRKTQTSNLESDTKRQQTTQSSCSKKKAEWDQRSNTRSSELVAFDTAVEILGKATGLATKAPSNPMAPVAPSKFLQIIQSHHRDPRTKAITMLREAAKVTHSQALERLAVAVNAHLNGPMDAVVAMIQKMIFRLKDEQKNEDEHKLWCDKELSNTNEMKSDNKDDVTELKANIKVAAGQLNAATEIVLRNQEKINAINTFVKEATEIRNAGKMENKEALSDAEEGGKAVSNAIVVLENFYKTSSSEQSEVATKLSSEPSTWTSKYNNVANPNSQPGGIITVLSKIGSDFAQMAAKTKAEENNDENDYKKAMSANKIDKSRLAQEVEMKNGEKRSRSTEKATLTSEEKSSQDQLDKTVQYLEDLKPACLTGDGSYNARKASRAKEIVALKAAQLTLAVVPKSANFLAISKSAH